MTSEEGVVPARAMSLVAGSTPAPRKGIRGLGRSAPMQSSRSMTAALLIQPRQSRQPEGAASLRLIWPFYMTICGIVAMGMLLAGCGGTALEFSGPLCGGAEPATFTLADHKDRAGFDARCTHTTYRADGTVAAVDEIVISSSESSASAVIAAQADAIGNLAGAIAKGAAP